MIHIKKSIWVYCGTVNLMFGCEKNNIKLKEVEVVSLEKQNIIFKVLKFIIRKLMG